MRCPFCNHEDTKVVDKRDAETGPSTRRRRECLKCKRRFTTYEKIESNPLIVVKKDNTREQFFIDKLKRGFLKACEKRPVTAEQIDDACNKIEIALKLTGKSEVNSRDIGEQVMRHLKRLDKVAYIRFASVYKDFQDVETFEKEIKKLR
jgi:transcriptional repressor NrdR